MIKTLLFDLGNVIIGLDFERAYRAVEKLSPYRAEEIPARIRETGLADTYERGDISSEEFYRKFCRALGMDVSFNRFQGLWQDMFQAEPLLHGSFFEALGVNYRLVLLSNTNELHFDFLRGSFPLLRHFDDYVLSYQVGALKPAEAIYQEAIRRAQCGPDECFFTDDKPVNVEAALRAGIDAVQFHGPASLKEQLRQRGVAWE